MQSVVCSLQSAVCKCQTLLSKSCMKTEQFLFYSEKQSLLTVELKNLTTKVLMRLFFPTSFRVVEKLCGRNY